MTSPSVAGLPASQLQTDAVTKKLFSTISVTDAAGNVSVVITLTNNGTATDADGLLSGGGLTKTGVGTYSLSSSTPASIQAALKALVFTPTAHQVAPGSTVVTGISLVATDTSTSAKTTVTGTDTVTAANTPPTVQGLNSQNISDESTTAPFAAVVITDPDKNAATSATITLTADGVATDANGLLSGAGLTKSGVGTYTVAATTPANLSAELAALSFTPTAHQVAPGDTLDTLFTLATAEGTAIATNSATIHVTAVTDSPVIDGTVTTDQPTTDGAAITPLSSVTITDVDAGQSETVTVALSDSTNGTLFDPNATDGSSYDSGGGVYSVTGSASEVTAALDSLVFTPTIHQVMPGQAVTTVLTITDTNTSGTAVADSNTTIIATAQDTAPDIAGLPGAESGTDAASLAPFGTTTITDPDTGAATSASITVTSDGTATDTDGLLSGNGLTKTGTGTYTLAATSPASLTSELQALNFTPTAHQVAPGSSVTTNFGVTVAEGTATSSANTILTTTAQDIICFMAGTAVQTPGGEVAVETLKTGDLVTLSDGRSAPVTWLGVQTVSMVFADPLRALPVRIRAGALGELTPRCDLLLSRDHALLVDGILVQAGALVNDVSIFQESEVPETFAYYHVEVADHSLIFAEGVAAETFVDNVDRMAFDNWAEHEALYGDTAAIVEMDLPRAKAHRQVPKALRSRLLARAMELYARDSVKAA
jgi:plastocyanin